VLIVNPNPCFDRTLLLSRLERGAVMRCESAQVTAGGKGINVARAARSLQKDAPILILAGDQDVDDYCELLSDEGADFKVTTFAGRVRVASIYMEKDSPAITIVNEKGSTITDADWDLYLSEIKKAVKPGQIVACMGSFPNGVTRESIHSLVEIVHQHQGLLLMDSSPEFLSYGLAAGVDCVSPNLDEAESLIYGSASDLFTGDSTDAERRAKFAAVELCKMGAKIALVTAGEVGVAIADQFKVEFVHTVKVNVVSAVGAGDSFVAGFISKSEEQSDVASFDAIDLRLSAEFGCAIAAASCENDRAGHINLERVSEIFRSIQNANTFFDMEKL
jgi:1-phosphofructokinase family hexose kinase